MVWWISFQIYFWCKNEPDCLNGKAPFICLYFVHRWWLFVFVTALYLWMPRDILTVLPHADLLCLLNNLSWRFFHIGTYLCTASLLCLFNVCGRMVSHSSVFSSVPPWWTGAECINLETQSLHIHTYRQVEFIAFLCRVKEERNEAEVCAWARLHVHVGSVYLRVNSEVMESLHVRIAFVLLYILHGLWESYTAEGGEGPVLPRKAW